MLKGLFCSDEHQFQQAALFLQNAVVEAERSDNSCQLPCALSELADVYISRNELAASESCLRRALSILDKQLAQTDPQQLEIHATLGGDKAECLAKLANVLKQEQKFTEAEDLYKKALKVSLEFTPESSLPTRISENYKQLLRSTGRGQLADRIEVNTKVNSCTNHEWTKLMLEIPRCYQQGRVADASKLVAVGAGLVKSGRLITSTSLLGETLCWLSFAKLFSGNLDEAAVYAKQALQIPVGPAYLSIYSISAARLTLIYALQGKSTEAEKMLLRTDSFEKNGFYLAESRQYPWFHGANLTRCKEIYHSAARNMEERTAAMRMAKAVWSFYAGRCCDEMHDPLGAESCYLEVSRLSSTAAVPAILAGDAEFRLGRFYRENHQPDKAIVKFEAAAKRFGPNNRGIYAFALYNASILQISRHEYEQALINTNSALQVYKPPPSKVLNYALYPILLGFKGFCEVQLGRFEEAELTYETALKFSLQRPDICPARVRKGILAAAASNAARQGKLEKANELKRLMRQIRDSSE